MHVPANTREVRVLENTNTTGQCLDVTLPHQDRCDDGASKRALDRVIALTWLHHWALVVSEELALPFLHVVTICLA